MGRLEPQEAMARPEALAKPAVRVKLARRATREPLDCPARP
jgi:hypothetical protein